MKKWFMFFLLIVLLLAGCSNDKNPNDEIKLLETQLNKLNEENYQLQNIIIDANNKIIEDDPVEKEIKEFLEGGLDKVIVSEYKDDPQSVEIKDSSIVSALRSILVMHKLESDPFPGGIKGDETSCYYDIHSGDKILSLNILYNGVVQVNREDGKEYFFQSSPDSYLLGKAFIKKPDYIPDEPILAKMYDSGLLMSYENSNKGVAYLSRYRIQGAVSTFLRIEKQETKKPPEPLELRNRLVFYYFGEKIEMNVYKNHMHIIDKEDEYWYYADEWDIHGIFAFLNAG